MEIDAEICAVHESGLVTSYYIMLNKNSLSYEAIIKLQGLVSTYKLTPSHGLCHHCQNPS